MLAGLLHRVVRGRQLRLHVAPRSARGRVTRKSRAVGASLLLRLLTCMSMLELRTAFISRHCCSIMPDSAIRQSNTTRAICRALRRTSIISRFRTYCCAFGIKVEQLKSTVSTTPFFNDAVGDEKSEQLKSTKSPTKFSNYNKKDETKKLKSVDCGRQNRAAEEHGVDNTIFPRYGGKYKSEQLNTTSLVPETANRG